MSLPHADHIVLLCAAGVGLILLAGVNLFLRTRGPRVRLLATALILLLLLVGFACWRREAGGLIPLAVLLCAGACSCLILSSSAAARLGTRVVGWLTCPTGSWSTLGVLGVLAVLLSVALAERAETDVLDLEQGRVAWEMYRPPLVRADVEAFTDLGMSIPLKLASTPRPGVDATEQDRWFLSQSPFRDRLIRQGEACDHANCHGWVFTGGRYWLSGEAVEQILADNGYTPRLVPRPGDLAIYRTGEQVCHTAIVRYVTSGLPVLVEGKWGPFGTYLHAVEHSSYGTDYTYYRSRRPGHLLHGLPDESGSSGTESIGTPLTDQ